MAGDSLSRSSDKTGKPALLCVPLQLSTRHSGPTIQLPVHSLPGVNPPEVCSYCRHQGLLSAVYTFVSKRGSVRRAYCKNIGLPKGGARVPQPFFRLTLLTTAAPCPLVQPQATVELIPHCCSENNGSVVPDVLMNSLFHG